MLAYTSLVSIDFEFFFLQGVRHPLPQGPHDRSYWIQLELTQLQGETYSIQIPQTTMHNDQLFLQSNL